jgi:hypothetical protein
MNSREVHQGGGAMNSKRMVALFSLVSLILVTAGVVFAVFGLASLFLVTGRVVFAVSGQRVLPIDRQTLLAWESAIYGAIMMGWGTTLFFVGRLALTRQDKELTKPLLAGIAIWLVVEAACSARYGVWFNIGVDLCVLALFSVPLFASLRASRKHTRRRGDV